MAVQSSFTFQLKKTIQILSLYVDNPKAHVRLMPLFSIHSLTLMKWEARALNWSSWSMLGIKGIL